MDEDLHDVRSHSAAPASPDSQPKRRRPALSCTVCRRRKLKCDRGLPCGQCVKSKAPDLCVYAGGSTHSRPTETPDRVHIASSRASPAHHSGGVYVFDSKHQSANRVTKPRGHHDEMYDLRHRIQVLEHALSRTAGSSAPTPDSSGCDAFSDAPVRGGIDSQYISEDVKHLPRMACFRGKNGKTRFCGRGHWTLSLSFFKDIGIIMRDRRNLYKSKDSDYARLKRLKSEVWSKEKQEHQRIYREKAFTLAEMIPQRRVADELLNLYLSTFETTYRILHVPTFLKQYDNYWSGAEQTDMVFMAKLLALMAASSCFFGPSTRLSENETLHTTASGWIMSVQSWIASTFVSSTINLDMLQIQCLLVIARQADATDGDVVWVSSGSLIRSAMTMGMHRSPLLFWKMTPFWAEMRRRLWATILELDLESSLDGGNVPTIDLDQYDCEPPSNYDDADLTEETREGALPKGPEVLTRNSFQVFLSRSLRLRVRIAKLVNSLKFSLSYDEALRLNEQLVQYMNEGLALLPGDGAGVLSMSGGDLSYARSFWIFLMRRFMLILHRPFALSVSLSPKFSFSRKICLESSLELLSQLDPPVVTFPAAQACPHLGQLGGGMFRDEFFHAAITVCVELYLQTDELPSKPATYGQPGSLSTLNDLVRSQQDVLVRAVEHTVDAIGSRLSTNGKWSKAYFFLCAALASVQARFSGEEPLKKVEQVSLRAIKDCEQAMRGATWAEIRARNDESVIPTLTPGLSSTTSDIPLDPTTSFVPSSTDILPLDFANLFDGADYGLPDLWDNDFLTSF